MWAHIQQFCGKELWLFEHICHAFCTHQADCQYSAMKQGPAASPKQAVRAATSLQTIFSLQVKRLGRENALQQVWTRGITSTWVLSANVFAEILPLDAVTILQHTYKDDGLWNNTGGDSQPQQTSGQDVCQAPGRKRHLRKQEKLLNSATCCRLWTTSYEWSSSTVHALSKIHLVAVFSFLGALCIILLTSISLSE